MAEVPVIQILDKKDFFKQALVPLPNELPLPPLAASSLRIKTEVMCLTMNNFTYCKLGSLLNWWDVHPLPASTLAPYNDADTYGRINCWGYARVLESTSAAAPPGSYLWGYLPIGTLPLDMDVRAGAVPGQVLVTSAYRQHLMPIYNRYIVVPDPEALSAEIARRADGVAYDALLRVMHETAYLLSAFVFAPDPHATVPPGPDPTGWGAGKADLDDATVLVFAPGSKVALAFAHVLRSPARTGAKPRRVVGVASEWSRSFVEGTGLYDAVMSSSSQTDPVAVLAGLGADPKDLRDDKVVIFDFGGRGGAPAKWAAALQPAVAELLFVAIGGEVSDPGKDDGTAAGKPPAPPFEMVQANADDMRSAAMGKVGERAYFEGLGASWVTMREEGVKGFKVRWGEGMVDVREGWDELARGRVRPDEGLAFKL
ncbi:Uu.00g011870.m01.CDS01 [Anthostomella pinea]|uniref:Uu.00g011870.m01.CDS01 n=1 Tax=Anthostomella pinea TaxID=933095 RepID=A0AAI8YQ42_9PEZI|nr:Uu.00g011870.m01.CDS01 [Anthostomella pinea]